MYAILETLLSPEKVVIRLVNFRRHTQKLSLSRYVSGNFTLLKTKSLSQRTSLLSSSL